MFLARLTSAKGSALETSITGSPWSPHHQLQAPCIRCMLTTFKPQAIVLTVSLIECLDGCIDRCESLSHERSCNCQEYTSPSLTLIKIGIPTCTRNDGWSGDVVTYLKIVLCKCQVSNPFRVVQTLCRLTGSTRPKLLRRKSFRSNCVFLVDRTVHLYSLTLLQSVHCGSQ